MPEGLAPALNFCAMELSEAENTVGTAFRSEREMLTEEEDRRPGDLLSSEYSESGNSWNTMAADLLMNVPSGSDARCSRLTKALPWTSGVSHFP